MLSFVRSFVCAFVRTFVRSRVRPFLRSFVRLFVRWFVFPFLRSFLSKFSFFRSVLFRSSVSTFVHSFTSEVSAKSFYCTSTANSDDNKKSISLLIFSDKHFWTQGFVMVGRDKLDCVPLFLGELSDDIFVCGKTINLLKLCCPEVCHGFAQLIDTTLQVVFRLSANPRKTYLKSFLVQTR